MDATDIQRKYLSRERTRCEIYQQIVDRCFRRLYWAVEQGHTHLSFKIPPWVFGLPRYSIPECELYLIDALKHKGFQVRPYGGGLVDIDWSQYLPDPKQVREVVRYEHTEKMKTPRNRLSISDNTWLNDGPLYPTGKAKVNRLALPPARPNPVEAKPFTRPGAVAPPTAVAKSVAVAQQQTRPVQIMPSWRPPTQQLIQANIQNWNAIPKSAPSVISKAPSAISKTNSMTISW